MTYYLIALGYLLASQENRNKKLHDKRNRERFCVCVFYLFISVVVVFNSYDFT